MRTRCFSTITGSLPTPSLERKAKASKSYGHTFAPALSEKLPDPRLEQVLHGMNAERCLLAGEALGLGYVALGKAAKYAKERIVFGRPIGQNQGIQHPLADAYMKLEAAKLATYHAAKLYDASRTDKSISPQTVGVACNSAKYLAAEAAFTACERAVCSLHLALLSKTVAYKFRFSPTEVWAMPRNTTWNVICASASFLESHRSAG